MDSNEVKNVIMQAIEDRFSKEYEGLTFLKEEGLITEEQREELYNRYLDKLQESERFIHSLEQEVRLWKSRAITAVWECNEPSDETSPWFEPMMEEYRNGDTGRFEWPDWFIHER